MLYVALKFQSVSIFSACIDQAQLKGNSAGQFASFAATLVFHAWRRCTDAALCPFLTSAELLPTSNYCTLKPLKSLEFEPPEVPTNASKCSISQGFGFGKGPPSCQGIKRLTRYSQSRTLFVQEYLEFSSRPDTK